MNTPGTDLQSPSSKAHAKAVDSSPHGSPAMNDSNDSTKKSSSDRESASDLGYATSVNRKSGVRRRRQSPGSNQKRANRVLEERSLLQRIAGGDERAVGECMDRYGGLVWSICRRLCRNVDDAEDAVQEVFIDLWASSVRFDPNVASEETFVAMIARRRVIDRWRKKRREPKSEVISEINDPAAPKESDTVEIGDEASRIQQMMTRLRPEQQQVLDLSIFRGLSHSDIAGELGLPLGTVKTHVRRGLMRVRELLGEDPNLKKGGSE